MSYHFLPGLGVASLPHGSLDGKPSAQSRSTTTAGEYCCSDSATECSTCSRSLTTLEISTGDPGVDAWILSLVASRASRGQSVQASNQANATNETSGPTPSGSFAKWDRSTSSWRTRQHSLLTNTREPFLGTWPKAGLIAAGTACRRRSLVRTTSASGYGLWPTPAARDHKGTSCKAWRDRKRNLSTLPDALAAALDIPNDVAIVPSPMFVEKLMLWPAMWTDSAPSEMGRFQSWLQAHGAS